MGFMKDLLIISAGKFGREIYGWASQAIAQGAPWKIKGFLDDRPYALDGFDYPVGILGTVTGYWPEAKNLFIGAVGDPHDKIKYYTPLLKRGAVFTNLIHPLSTVGPNVTLGHGVILPPFSMLTSDVKVGNFVSFGGFSGAGHDVTIGDWCQISGHCGINGNAVLEEGVFLGSHSAILPHAKVGGWAYVGAGSVVLRRVKPRTKVFGNPAVPIGTVSAPNQANKPAA